ncbi:oxidoreductase [Labrys miyagiensis]
MKEAPVALWKNGQFEANSYRSVGDDEVLPEGAVIVSLKRFLAEKDALSARNTPLGVLLQPADKIELIADDLPGLPLLALAFPKFGDGRAFSLARIARERYGFRGELRAVGDILFDRVAYMIRCGFDALDISNAPTVAALEAGKVPVSREHYQPTGTDGKKGDPLKPWRRWA